MPDMDGGKFITRCDPQEGDPQLRAIIKAAEKEAEESLRKEGVGRHLGYCHRLWGRQKQILKEKYGIDWRSPAEMNPDIMYD